MRSLRAWLGFTLVTLVASVAVYSSLDTGMPVLRPGLAMTPPSATALRPLGAEPRPVVLGESRPLLGERRVVLGERSAPPVLGGGPIRPVLGGDSPLPAVAARGSSATPAAPRAAADAGAVGAARRLLALLPREDCAGLIRFADDQADRYRRTSGAQWLVNALEAAQQFCYQRERYPEIAAERRQEAERLAQRVLRHNRS